MLPKLKTRGIDIQDRQGKWRTIYPCSVLDRERLRERITQIWDFVENYPDESASFEDLIQFEDQFRYWCEDVLKIAEIPIDWLDYPQWQAMVLPYQDGEGNQQTLPVLIQLNFENLKSEKNIDPKKSDDFTVFDVVAALWGSQGSLLEALEVTSILPMQELQAVLEKRAKIMEEASKSDIDKSKEKVKKRLIKDQNKMYDNLPENHPIRKRWESYKAKRGVE